MAEDAQCVSVAGVALPVHSTNTLVIGSGAAALNAVLQLLAHGQRDVLLVTERWGAGASFESGSDKQTYYKLSSAHGQVDSPRQMAEDLCSGGCMHGDIALCEAQHSAQAFYHLVSRGVPFPHDRYGAYVGYRTDHDPKGRATSAGPLTSRMMCAGLGRAVRDAGVRVLDEHPVVALLTRGTGQQRVVCGALAIDKRQLDNDHYGFVLLNAVNVVLATGGPGGLYRDSVYPESQRGSTGLALSIGAVAQNLTESQFGLGSIGFRWNVSGSYQQVIPRYMSTDATGGDAREFLNDHFPSMAALTAAVFAKGYAWPFDCASVADRGSSLIDVLVFRERVQRGRRVFLDFTRNPGGGGTFGDFSLDRLPEEARAYLEESGALCGTPVQRLAAMNQPALDLYREHDIDLTCDLLEIGVCGQHNNGGLVGNLWWESNVRHLFPVGEVNGSHGVRRPGGAALNAGQVGGFRTAMYIAKRYRGRPPVADAFRDSVAAQVAGHLDVARRICGGGGGVRPEAVIDEVQGRMSASAGIVRKAGRVRQAVDDAWRLHARALADLRVDGAQGLPAAFAARDACLTHAVYLEALREYLDRGGASRGSFLVLDEDAEHVIVELERTWRFGLTGPEAFVSRKILEVWVNEAGGVEKRWVDVRPIPAVEGWFENVWRDYRHDRVVREESGP